MLLWKWTARVIISFLQNKGVLMKTVGLSCIGGLGVMFASSQSNFSVASCAMCLF